MILLERHSISPQTAQTRAQVLQHLGRHHLIREFVDEDDLNTFLDQLELRLLQRGHQGLTRVLLMYATPALVPIVARRMAPGRRLMAYAAPECWEKFLASLQESGEQMERTR